MSTAPTARVSSASPIFPSSRIGRQTFLVAGALVLAGLALGIWVNAWFLLAAMMPGIGMLLTAATGFCPMSWLLARMPWNRQSV